MKIKSTVNVPVSMIKQIAAPGVRTPKMSTSIAMFKRSGGSGIWGSGSNSSVNIAVYIGIVLVIAAVVAVVVFGKPENTTTTNTTTPKKNTTTTTTTPTRSSRKTKK